VSAARAGIAEIAAGTVISSRAVNRRASGKRPAVPPEEDTLLRGLEAALSDDEIRRVLACALLVLDDDARERLLACLAPETGAALGPVLSRPRARAGASKAPAAAAGKGKLRQDWDRLWAEWDEVVEESGQEHGKYIRQDADWEQPYLDTTSVERDLEAIASRIRALIPRVVAPEFSFAHTLDEMDEALFAGLPDWIEPGERCHLGAEATACLLAWEWAVAEREGRDASAFLDGIRDLEARLKKIALDHDVIQIFVLALSDEQLRSVLANMVRQRSSARWGDAFSRARGCWAEIVRKLSRRWNPVLHAETSRANIAQDWTLALPLIEDAVKRKSLTEAATLIDEALRSRLRLDKPAGWEPREELLVEREHSYYGDDESAKLAALLRRWQQIANAQGQADLAAALALQIVALRKAEHGDVMLEAFAAIPQQFQTMRDGLFAQWRALIARRTLQIWHDDRKVTCGDWVASLVDSARAGAKGAKAFRAAVRAALDEARANLADKPKPARGWHCTAHHRGPSSLFALAVLTRDLDATAPTFKKAAPRLWRLLDAESSEERNALAATRRTWCARLGGPSLIPEVMGFWRQHATSFVPDPGATTGDYSMIADWLAAVEELNPNAAREMISGWVTAHHRKRNLWRDLAQRGVRVPAELRLPAR
jgi:hypothetical protein